jgi:hypothetical protein
MRTIAMILMLTVSLLLLGLGVPGDSQHKEPVPLVRVNTQELKHLAEQHKATREKRIRESGELPRMTPASIRLTDRALIPVNHPWTNTPVINATVTSRPYPNGIERRLFSDGAVLSMGALFFNADPTQAVCFFVDPFWNRIIFGNKAQQWIRSYGEWHGPPRNEYYLAGPRALTVDAIPNNDVYVADSENDRIVKLNYSVGYLANVATFHDLRMMHPVDITLSFMGDYLWIADDYSGKILRMERSGSFPGSAIEYYRIGQQTVPIRRPSNVCADNSLFGERLGFIDGATNTFVVGYLSQVSGNTMTALSATEFTQSGSRLSSIGVDMNENWWVADPGLGMVHVFDIFGEYLGSMNQPTLPYSVSTSPSYFDGQYILQVPYIYMAEKWSDERGLRTYFPGADVIDMQVQETQSHFQLRSVLTNACLINVKIVRASDGSLVQTLSSASSYANPHRTDEVAKSSLAYGHYKFRVEVKPMHNDEYGEYRWQDWLVREVPFTYSPALLQSSTPTATATSNQRKVIAAGDVLDAVYTSDDAVWYCRNVQGVWSAPLRLSNPGAVAKNPNLHRARFGEAHLHVVWEEVTNDGRHWVYYRRSTTGGVSWENPIRLGGVTYASDIDATPVIAEKVAPGGGFGYIAVLWARKQTSTGTGGIQIVPDPWRQTGDWFVLEGSNAPSRFPSADGYTTFRVAFADSATGTIKVREFDLSYDGSRFSISYPGTLQDISAEYPWMHQSSNPSIAIADPYVFVSWDADRDPFAEEEEHNAIRLDHHVFVRGYAPWCGWAPVTEFIHGGHDGKRASVGVDQQVGKVHVVWECSGSIARSSRLISGVQWSTIEDLGTGAFPSIEQRVSVGAARLPYVMYTTGSTPPFAIAFSNNFNRPFMALQKDRDTGRYSPGAVSIPMRGGAVRLDSLGIGPWPKGTVRGDFWVESAPFAVVRGSTREPVVFSPDTLDFSDWLGTQTAVIPRNADRIEGKLKVYARKFRVADPRIPLTTVMFATRLTVENHVAQILRTFTLGDLYRLRGLDTTLIVSFSVPAAPLRGKAIRVQQRLIGQDENQQPGWSELIWSDTSAGTGLRGTAGIAKLSNSLEGIPSAFALHTNYPNPFNPTTVLRFDLPEEGYVRLEVFDILGKSVAVLADGLRPAGYYSVVWDAGSYASGIYVARLQVTDGTGHLTFSRATKLVLSK